MATEKKRTACPACGKGYVTGHLPKNAQTPTHPSGHTHFTCSRAPKCKWDSRKGSGLAGMIERAALMPQAKGKQPA